MELNEALNRVKEAKNMTEDDVLAAFATFVKENYPEIWVQSGSSITGLEEEDYDFFSSAFEVNTVRRKSGGKGEQWVGMLVAYDGKRDMMQRQRDVAIESATINLSQVLRYGIQQNNRTIAIGRVTKADGEWSVFDADDKLLYKETAEDGKQPMWVIHTQGPSICLLKDDGRTPKRAFMEKRKWIFIGNTQEKFLTEGALPPMVLECSFSAASAELQLLRPISFKAELTTAWKPADSTEPDEEMLSALDIDADYGLDWVDDEVLPKVTELFSPDQYIAQFMPCVDLSDVFDHHMSKRKVLASGRDYGPIFAISGTVDYIDHAGKENLYTEGGFKHSITLTSNSLRRDDPKASLWIDVSRYLVENQHAFKVKKADGWKDYASGSRIWVVVRSRTWEGTDGGLNLNLDGLGVYAMPLRSIIAQTPPEDANDISYTDGF